MTSAVATLAEQGRLVSVRSRRWVVGEVNKSTLPPVSAEAKHLVSLLSVEDDALGEELQVAWEIEPAERLGPDPHRHVFLPRHLRAIPIPLRPSVAR
jgi:hypothetical protein